MRIGLTTISVSALILASSVMANDQLTLGKAVFSQQAAPACSVCHALSDAGAGGQIGPNLDDMSPDFDRVFSAVTQGVGIMPAFSESLTEEQRRAVAFYVSEITKQ